MMILSSELLVLAERHLEEQRHLTAQHRLVQEAKRLRRDASRPRPTSAREPRLSFNPTDLVRRVNCRLARAIAAC